MGNDAGIGARELAGKVALVTGGALNIGRSISLALADAGAAVAINTRSSREEADGLVDRIKSAGGKAETCVADIADGAAVREMADGVLARYGRVDILVLNASIRREVPFKDMTVEAWREIMSISLDGSFHCIKAVLPSMIEARGGNIIMLGGDNALSGAVGKASSSAAKNGLVGLTRSLAKELAEYNIRVNCVSPGNMNTTRPSYRPPKSDPKGTIPLGRYGEPDEIAATVRFLCGPGGGFITGQTIHVNGGQYMFA